MGEAETPEGRQEQAIMQGYYRIKASSTPMEKIRLDKWLWAARFYKTRSLACEEISKGRVNVNNMPAKPAREVGPGDLIAIRKGAPPIEVRVKAVSGARGPAPVAQQLYEETDESKLRREAAAELRRLAPEPADTIRTGRPTKRDRRLIEHAKRQS